jgi:hypothetical protein
LNDRSRLPLTRSQEKLRGRKKPVEMTVAELHDWIAACNAMEAWPGMDAKGRRFWKASRAETEAELARRDAAAKPPAGDSEETDADDDELPAKFRAMRSRVMYIESKSGGLEGSARIGRVYFSKTGKTLYYRDQRFRSLKGSGFKSNYYETGSGDAYWISGPRKDRNDRLYGGSRGVQVDADVKDEYLALVSASRGKRGKT